MARRLSRPAWGWILLLIGVGTVLDARGLEVYLVNARHTKNLPGRKSDVQESQWRLKLHAYGLLPQLVPPTCRDSRT